MVRSMSPLDLIRIGLPRGLEYGNRAFTLDRVAHVGRSPGYHLVQAVQLALALRSSSRVAFAEPVGFHRFPTLVAARRRSGPASWEISHLFVGSDHESSIANLLERVSRACVAKGAQRVFLRLREDDPLMRDCQRAGFFPCHGETLYLGRFTNDLHDAPPDIYPRESLHDYPLFRLHNASTPSSVRRMTGMTFEQWQSSEEGYLGRRREFVFVTDDSVKAWIETRRRLSTGQISIRVHPDAQNITRFLVRFALDRLRGLRQVACLVPEYETALRRALEQEELTPASSYTALVKSTATTVEEKAPVSRSMAVPM